MVGVPYELDSTIRASLVRLDALSATNDSHNEKLTGILAEVAAVNAALLEARITPSQWEAQGGYGIVEQLKNWIIRLIEKLSQVTADAKASGFSVSVGTTVSVSVNFDVRYPTGA